MAGNNNMITPDINNDISYYDLPKRKAVSLGKNNNMITPKINNNKECKADPIPLASFPWTPARFLRVPVALETAGDGNRSAARVRTRNSPPLHAPPTSLAHPFCMLAHRRPDRPPSFPPQAELSEPLSANASS